MYNIPEDLLGNLIIFGIVIFVVIIKSIPNSKQKQKRRSKEAGPNYNNTFLGQTANNQTAYKQTAYKQTTNDKKTPGILRSLENALEQGIIEIQTLQTQHSQSDSARPASARSNTVQSNTAGPASNRSNTVQSNTVRPASNRSNTVQSNSARPASNRSNTVQSNSARPASNRSDMVQSNTVRLASNRSNMVQSNSVQTNYTRSNSSQSGSAKTSIQARKAQEDKKKQLKEHFGLPEGKIHNEIHNENHVHDEKDILCRANINNKIFDETGNCILPDTETLIVCGYNGQEFLDSLQREFDKKFPL